MANVAGRLLPSSPLVRLECVGRGMSGALNAPAVPGLREWLADKAGQAYQGFLHNLAADPRACVLEIVEHGGIGPRPAGAA